VDESVPKLSILISVYGQADKLEHCLSCIEKTLSYQINYEVLIIDDASVDGTTHFIESLASTHRVFFNQNNKGFAKNNNFLARNAKGEYLCLLNSDAYVQGNWLFPMLDAFKQNLRVGLVGNVQKLHGSLMYDHAGVVFGPQGNPRHYGQGFLVKPGGQGARRWSAVTAACVVVKKETFLHFDGFDEVFINGCEDVELCIRMSRKGFQHFVAHNSVVEHVKGASAGRKRYNQRNFELLMKKWGESIRSHESLQDQKLHAFTYIIYALVRPHLINFGKFCLAVSILLGLRELSGRCMGTQQADSATHTV
jgi:GT2 family glycosyltransferase